MLGRRGEVSVDMNTTMAPFAPAGIEPEFQPFLPGISSRPPDKLSPFHRLQPTLEPIQHALEVFLPQRDVSGAEESVAAAGEADHFHHFVQPLQHLEILLALPDRATGVGFSVKQQDGGFDLRREFDG